MPMSCSTLVKNREYSRCRIACSTPPTYSSTGSQRRTRSASKAAFSSVDDGERRKYHDESTNVSIVSVSRVASPPHDGHFTVTQSVALSSGDRPPSGRSSYPLRGSSTGRSSSGTATSPQPLQCTIGIGQPQ